MKKQPTAQKIIEHCELSNTDFVIWYNRELKLLNL